MNLRRILTCLVATATLFSVTTHAAESRLYIGTYTGAKSKGIYVSSFDPSSGTLSTPALAAELRSPSFLAASPNGKILYAVNEVADHDGKNSGAVSALAIDATTGLLRLINQQPSGGGGPCHLGVSSDGKHVLVANYGGGSVCVLPIQPDGLVGAATAFVQHQGSSVNNQRQEGPHAHGIYLDKSDRWAVVPDLGLDQLKVYRFDASRGGLRPGEPAFAASTPGACPRHFAFQPNGALACAINELDSTLCSYRFDAATGRLTLLDTASTLPSPTPGNSTAEVFFSGDGRFVYGSNRGHDSIAVFAIDGSSGKLKSIQHESTHGKTPRSFALDPTGRWLLVANQGSDSITVFSRDPATGRLEFTGKELRGIGAPVCLLFL